MRSIDGFAALLEGRCGGMLDEEGRRLLQVIRESARKMGSLIDGLLRFSRLGRQEVGRKPVDMKRLVEEVVEELVPDRKKVDVRVGPLPPAVADEGLIREVLVNLLSNALKFSSRRPRPVIDVGWDEAAGQGSYFIRDNGAGFDPEYVHKLFGVFERLHLETDFGGNGIGLALVKRIVERHGGKVRAEGRPGEGATFWFTLPGGHALEEVPVRTEPA